MYLCKITIIFTKCKLRNTIKKGNVNFIFQLLCIPIAAKCFPVSTNILVASVICICQFFQNNCTSFLCPCLCSKFCSMQCKATASVNSELSLRQKVGRTYFHFLRPLLHQAVRPIWLTCDFLNLFDESLTKATAVSTYNSNSCIIKL